jgi:hypothetical protein
MLGLGVTAGVLGVGALVGGALVGVAVRIGVDSKVDVALGATVGATVGVGVLRKLSTAAWEHPVRVVASRTAAISIPSE